MILPPDYDKYFEGKIVVITGVARSGTTIMGKIVGSLEDCFYSFEPVSFSLLLQLTENNILPFNQAKDLIKGILFEDFFLQAIHGRNVNFNENDDSFIGNYINIEKIKVNWKRFRRRTDVLNYLERNEVTFVVKNPNLQPCMKTLIKIFPKIKIIHMVRNGNDVINSSMKRGFYTKEYLNYSNVDCWSIKNKEKDLNIPWYVKDKQHFPDWNYQTRCAHIWRVLNRDYLNFRKLSENNILNVKLENFVKNPNIIMEKIQSFLKKKKKQILQKRILNQSKITIKQIIIII